MALDIADIPFHDAEIVSLHLHRGGPSLRLELEVLPGTPAAYSVVLVFEDVSDLELGGFNNQNVLFDLQRVPRGAGGWDVELHSSYGVGGRFDCSDVSCERLPSSSQG
jgi:hypothetical protein